MTMSGLTRRQLLQGATLLPLTWVALVSGCADNGTSYCADPELLGPGEAQMRKTLKYLEISTDDKQQCTGCQFFSAPSNNCGHCELLDGAVNTAGFCTSWVKRA
jgi:hypothetical protein